MGQGYPLPCPLIASCGPYCGFLCCLWMQAAWVGAFLPAPVSQYIFTRGFRSAHAPASPVAPAHAHVTRPRTHAHAPAHPRLHTHTRIMRARAHARVRTHTHTHVHAAPARPAPAAAGLPCWPGCACPALLHGLTLPFFSAGFSALFAFPSLSFSATAAPATCCTCCTVLLCCTAAVLCCTCCTLRSGPALIRRIGKPCESFGTIRADSFLIPLRDTLKG